MKIDELKDANLLPKQAAKNLKKLQEMNQTQAKLKTLTPFTSTINQTSMDLNHLELKQYQIQSENLKDQKHDNEPAIRSGMIGMQIHQHLDVPEQVCFNNVSDDNDSDDSSVNDIVHGSLDDSGSNLEDSSDDSESIAAKSRLAKR